MQLPRSQIQGVFSEFVKVALSDMSKELTINERNMDEKAKGKIRTYKKQFQKVNLFKLHS